MTTNKQRSTAVRARMAETGESFTKASFAIKAQPTAAEPAPAKPARPDVSRYYGRIIVAKAPHRRTRTGLLLPPAPGSRSTLPRLQPEDATEAARFDPTGYEITPPLSETYGKHPVYYYSELPGTNLLATKTTLHDEMRRKPADPDAPIAYFYSQTAKDYFALYATVDSIALPALSEKRQAAWEAARTCASCGKKNPFAFRCHITTTKRYCSTCWPDARAADFIARQRPIQLQQVEWSKQVLADANVVLAGNKRTDTWRDKRHFATSRTRIETLAGDVLLDMTVAVPFYGDLDLNDPEELAIFESLTPAEERRQAVAALRDRRLITFDAARSYFLDDGQNRFPADEDDHVARRYCAWAGVTRSFIGRPHRQAPTVDLLWSYNPEPHPYTYGAWEKLDAEGKIDLTRECLRLIATEPPAPTYERS